ncbi:CUB and sushi domain-containing protein 1-like [Dreissena polymorpha]|uniref:CUB and sushi domain-containing protein 1-like n=1 Tax=Dreissena polymorpha TaxID=45954 RepID=UPI00226558FA|nr:CUB and sushi domain-containing protein 1-like [Dreissena polymorpha]
MKVDVDETHKEAKAVCTRQGSDLFMLNNDIEYDEAVHKLFPTKNIWIAYKTNDTSLDFIKRWANFEPVVIPDQPGCIVLDPIASKTRVADCDERHAFVCKRRACLQGYVSCDKAAKCIPMERMCDGNMDCDDTSDEFFNCSSKGYHSIHVNGTSSLNTGTLTAGNQKTWNLVAPIGRRIRIFIQSTTLAANLAFLDIYSGTPYMQEASLIKRFTGTVSSQYIYSTNNFLTINMYAQNVQSAVPAFNILYTSDLPDIFHGFKDLTASIIWEQLVFPYQNEMNKPAQLQLRWRITAPVGQLISYYLEKVDSSKPLQAEIMSGDWTLFMDHIYVSGTNTLEIVMKEVPSNTKLVYKTGCGQNVSHHSGMIISPNIMGVIPNNVMCSWTLDGGQRAGRGMSLKFYTNFTSDPRITPGSRSEDYITINADGKTVKNYTDRIYSSRNGLVVINLTSDAALNSNSFRIEFATDCPALNVSSETNKSNQGAVFEEDVELSCPTGHKFHLEKYSENRSLTLTCGKDQQWYIKEEKLVAIPECRVVYCGPPPKIENGYIVKATGATYNSTTMYSCAQGFTMFENKNATCDENGKWMNAPTCDSATCEALYDDMLLDGSWSIIAGNNFTNGNADFNTVVKFSCNSGFELIGPIRTRCTDVGWTHQNTPPSCARLPCTKPVVANGNLIGTLNPVYGDTLNATCNPGFRLSNSAPYLIVMCGVNQTFDIMATCVDINECNSGLSTCHVDTTTCENTEGNFTCRCRAGFNANNGTACTDILECDNNNGGCSHTCNEQQPNYKCSCPEGFVLFMQGGNEGFTARPSETGNMPGDVYLIGHTCVPKQCPSLPPLANGQYLTKDTVFHYNDSVEVHCNDGYFLTGRSSTDATIECQDNGRWNETLTCQARSCNMPVPPSNGVFNVNSVSFMQTVTLTCNLTETKQVSKSAVCVYISKAEGMRLAGDNLTCPGMMCSDPGTPGGMTQLATSYEIGAKLSYRCTRSGFEPTGPQNYTCQYDAGSGSAVWSYNLTSNPPSCQDTEKPKVTMCPNYSSDYFYAMGTVNFMTPNFTDNYGIKIFNRAGSSLRSGDVLSPSSSQINMSFIATDYDGNTETCSYTFNVYDKSVKPNITCPQVKTVTVTDQNGVSVNVSDWITVTDMPHHNTRLSFSPSVVTGTVANIGTSQEVTATARFTSGPNVNVDSHCKFLVNFVAGMCFKEQLFSDHNSVRNCLSNATGSLVCTSTCNSSYVYGDGATVKKFTCSGGNEWDYNFVDPANRFCLPIQSSDDTITTSVVYDFSTNNYNCNSQFASKVAPMLSTFATRLSTSCDGLSWTVEHTNTTLVTSSQYRDKFWFK